MLFRSLALLLLALAVPARAQNPAAQAQFKEATRLMQSEGEVQAVNPLEEAMGYQVLAAEFNHSQEDIAKVVGKSRSHVANTLRLLKLPDSVKAYINAGKLSAGHARALIGQADPETAAREIVEKGLNVRQVEALTQTGPKAKVSKARAQITKDADTAALERRLSDVLGLKVEIDHKSKGGVVRVRYRTLDQLDDIVRRLERD